MAGRGVHFALTDEQASRFAELADDDALMEFVEEVEGDWDREWVYETDKAWDAIHRCLTDGKLEWGETSLYKCVLGSGDFYEGDGYVVNFLDPAEVKEVAATIQDIDRDELRRRYDAIDVESDYGELSDSDFAYTWDNFAPLRNFFQKAAAAGRAVMFTVDL